MSPAPVNPVTVRVTRRFAASPERVFDAWLDPATAGRWFYATPNGQMQRVEIDARVGGGYVVVEKREQSEAAHYGRYLEIDRPRRLVFTLSVEPDTAHGDVVTVDIAPDGDGCIVTLVHEMAAEYAQYADRTRTGWTSVLDGLARHVGSP